jgi:chaperonin GroEL
LSDFETNLTGTKGDKYEIKERLDDLREKINKEENKNLKEVMKRRLSNLEGKTAIIAIGGLSEIEVAENRDKIIDCLNSCKSAIDNGILPGGGTSFIHVIKILQEKLKELKRQAQDDEKQNYNHDFIMGIECLMRALKVKRKENLLFHFI